MARKKKMSECPLEFLRPFFKDYVTWGATAREGILNDSKLTEEEKRILIKRLDEMRRDRTLGIGELVCERLLLDCFRKFTDEEKMYYVREFVLREARNRGEL